MMRTRRRKYLQCFDGCRGNELTRPQALPGPLAGI
jgi:hypothetical protein